MALYPAIFLFSFSFADSNNAVDESAEGNNTGDITLSPLPKIGIPQDQAGGTIPGLSPEKEFQFAWGWIALAGGMLGISIALIRIKPRWLNINLTPPRKKEDEQGFYVDDSDDADDADE